MKEIIWDKWGMILQTGDGGDTAANMGTYHLFLETRRRMGHVMFNDGPWPYSDKAFFMSALSTLSDPELRLKNYRRHPNPAFWGSRVNTMSRDQTIPLLAAMALYGMRGHVWRYVLQHFKRGFLFTTNTTPNWSDPVLHDPKKYGWTWKQKLRFFFGWDPGYPVYATKLPDVTLFEFWALELRGLYSPWFKPFFFPVLCGLDVFTVIGSISKVFGYAKDPSHSDDRNHVNTILVGLQVCPTPLMKFAAWIYRKRPRAQLVVPSNLAELPASEYLTLPSGPQSALDHYYRAPDSPPFNELGRSIIKYYFEGTTK